MPESPASLTESQRRRFESILQSVAMMEVKDAQASATAALRDDPLVLDAVVRELRSVSWNIPSTIGPYRVIRKLGRGGMGDVYLGVKEDDRFRQHVAIKVIRKGKDTEDVLDRFRRERQILNALEHPNIVRVLDAGQTDDGRPYFVMKYVEGVPITKFCDDRRLSTADRLALFRQVCAAVQHAHRNLIVHRDIKPSNILVTTESQVKLIDFGIAKLLNPDLIGFTHYTDPRATPLTLEYASPEQILGQPITVASDIYSMGVLLYELFSGRLPLGFETKVDEEIRRIAEEVQPMPPSEAVTTDLPSTAVGTATREQIAHRRDTSVANLARSLQGDLDNIALMALKKEPQRRYSSVDQFEDDIRRYLQSEPVRARKDSSWYVLQKFVAKYRWPLIGAGVVVVALSALSIALSVQWSRAEARAREVRRLSEDMVRQLDAVVQGVGKERFEGSVVDSRRKLAEAVEEVAQSLVKQLGSTDQLSILHAKSLALVGSVLGSTRNANEGNRDAAIAKYQQAIKVLGSPAVAAEGIACRETIRCDLAGLLNQGDAIREYTTVIDSLSPLLDGTDATDAAQWAVATAYLERAKRRGWGEPASESDLEHSEQIRRARVKRSNTPERERSLAVLLTARGQLLEEKGDRQGALRAFQESYDIRERLAPSKDLGGSYQRDLMSAKKNMGWIHLKMGSMADSIVWYQGALGDARHLCELDPLDDRARKDFTECTQQLLAAVISADTKQVGSAIPKELGWEECHELCLDAQRVAAGRLKQRPDAVTQRTLAYLLRQDGIVLQRLGRTGAAVKAWLDSKQLLDQIIAGTKSPNDNDASVSKELEELIKEAQDEDARR